MSEMDKTKVLHIVGALNLGGAETMIMNIFRNIDRSRFQFDFYLSGDSGGFYEEEVLQLGGRILNVGRRKKHPVKYCTELFKLIRKEKYDAVQIHATDAQDGLPAVVARLSRVGDYTKYYLKDGVNSVVFEGCDANSCAKAIRRAMSFSEDEYIEISSKARECVERQFDYHNWTKKSNRQ